MKKVLSISVGSPSRDHTTVVNFLGQEIELSRQGTNGDLKKAIELYKHFDGKVDAFGVGGLEFYLGVGDKKYYFRDAKKVRRAIKISKVGDGSPVGHVARIDRFRVIDNRSKHVNRKLQFHDPPAGEGRVQHRTLGRRLLTIVVQIARHLG